MDRMKGCLLAREARAMHRRHCRFILLAMIRRLTLLDHSHTYVPEDYEEWVNIVTIVLSNLRQLTVVTISHDRKAYSALRWSLARELDHLEFTE